MSRQNAIQTATTNDIQVHTQAQPPQAWSYLPVMDVIETENEYAIVLDAPGVVRDQVTLTYEAGVVHLHGPVAPRYPSNGKFLRQEYGVGDFDRTIPLGRLAEFVDGDRISAEYELGVVTVRMPKLAGSQPRQIRINPA